MTGRILNVSRTNDVGTIDIYGEVVPESWRWEGDVSATSFKKSIENLDGVNEIIVNINSPGGDVFEGITIHNMLKRHKAKITVNVDGLAASIASVIAMAGDVVRMPSNSMMMIHNAMSGSFGNAEELRELADLLDKVTGALAESYLNKSDKLNSDTLKALLDAETWLTAEEAFNYGLIDEVITSKQLVACASKEQLSKFNKTPGQMIALVETPKNAETLTKEDIKAIVNDALKEQVKEKPKAKKRLYL